MKNLINEIKMHRFTYSYDDDFRKGYNGGLDAAVKILEQYNVITALKQIKLSELINKLRETILGENARITINPQKDKLELHIYKGNEIKDSSYIFSLGIKDHSKKIYNIKLINGYYFFYGLKWFYTLWITDTEIINDYF